MNPPGSARASARFRAAVAWGNSPWARNASACRVSIVITSLPQQIDKEMAAQADPLGTGGGNVELGLQEGRVRGASIGIAPWARCWVPWAHCAAQMHLSSSGVARTAPFRRATSLGQLSRRPERQILPVPLHPGAPVRAKHATRQVNAPAHVVLCKGPMAVPTMPELRYFRWRRRWVRLTAPGDRCTCTTCRS